MYIVQMTLGSVGKRAALTVRYGRALQLLVQKAPRGAQAAPEGGKHAALLKDQVLEILARNLDGDLLVFAQYSIKICAASFCALSVYEWGWTSAWRPSGSTTTRPCSWKPATHCFFTFAMSS
jgi:hypothetical protein